MSDTQPSSGRSLRPWFAFTLCHAILLQIVVLLLRVTTSYRAVELGLEPFWLGVIACNFAILPAFFSISLGRWVDIYGELLPLRLGALLSMAAAVGFLLTGSSVLALSLCSAALGMGHLVSSVGEHSIVARCAPPDGLDLYFGRFTVAIALGQVAGPLIVPLFAREGLLPDTHAMFVGGIGIAVLLVVVTFVTPVPKGTEQHAKSTLFQSLRTLLRTHGFLLSVWVGLVVITVVDLMVIYMPVLGVERHISVGAVGALLSVRAGAAIVSRVLFNRLVRMLGRGGLLALCLLLSAGATAAAAVTASLPVLFLEMAIAGFGLGMGAPLTLTWVSSIAPAGQRASALSFRLAGNRVAQAAVPLCAGVAASAFGAGGVFLVGAAGLAAAGVATIRFFEVFKRR